MATAINGQTIADVRNQAIGQTVTITGVATNGPELGPIRYIQDGTAGLPAYGSNLSSIQRGDSVTATGVLFEFVDCWSYLQLRVIPSWDKVRYLSLFSFR